MSVECTRCGKVSEAPEQDRFKEIREKWFCTECFKALNNELLSELDNIIITTTDNIEGYKIKKYVGIESAEVVFGANALAEAADSISDFMGKRSTGFESKLQDAKKLTLNKLKFLAYVQGANAIIGVDLDYTELAGNRIGLIANGTLVSVEEI